MSSRNNYTQIGKKQVIKSKIEGTNKVNRIKTYSTNKVIVEKTIKTSYNNNITNNTKNNINQTKSSQFQTKSKFPVITNQAQNKNITQSNDIELYEYNPSNFSNANIITLKHHPNQVNNLIHNHKFYSSITTSTQKTTKTSKSVNNTRSERIQSLSPSGKSKYLVETKKVEVFNKPRYSSITNSSKETNVSLSKTQLKQFIKNAWLEEMYCSNVESLCCLVDNQNTQRNNNSIEIYEKELEQKDIIIKEYEAEILKLKGILNIKEQEMKKLMQNLKQSESSLKIKNQKLYELNKKTINKNEILDKDAHELQIISTRKERNIKANLDKDAHSLQIISLKNKWSDNLIPSPVNEIYILTVLNANHYEEMKKRKMIEEETIRKAQLEKEANLEFQEMGTLSIITRKPKKENLCQHLESIMIISREKKFKNEIQELAGLEVLHKKKNKIIQEQRLNGLEIQRDYDMLLVKPVWNSLKIQGSGLNLLAIPRDVQLENQEIDEFEIRGKQPEKIKVLLPIAENNIQKITNFEIIGKMKIKTEYKIKKEMIKLDGIPKKEINWNEIIIPIKSTKLLVKRNYEKIEHKTEIKVIKEIKETNWNNLLKPEKSTKLSIKKIVKEVPKKITVLEIINKDNFNFLYSSPKKILEEFEIENFNMNLIAPEKVLIKSLKISKKPEKKEITLINNKIDSINIIGLKKKIILTPSSTQKIKLISEEVEVNNNWDKSNKVMKTRELNIPKKTKIENKISKKTVDIEIKANQKKEMILKPIKAHKLFIKRITKKIIKKPSLKQIKENKLFIRSIKKEEKRPERILKQMKETKLFIKGLKKEIEKPKIQKVNWNDLIKIQKSPNINLIQKKQKIVFKKQNLNSFTYRGIEQVEIPRQEKIIEKIITTNNWSNSIKAQRNSKFEIKGKIKKIKLSIIKGDKFMIKREPEEEIIFNDDYNHLTKKNKENGKEKAKKEIVVIKEKEITPIIQREIRAQVIRIKEESSEASSQSEVDILGGIQKFGISEQKYKNLGYSKKVINGEVIFTPKTNLGINLGGAKYKREMITKKSLNININKKEQGKITGLEINANNGQVYHERMSGIGGVIKEGNYKIINGSTSNLTQEKKFTPIYQSTANIRKSNKTTKIPNDSNKKDMKKLFLIKSKVNEGNRNETLTYGNITNGNNTSNNVISERNKTIIIKSNLTTDVMKHSSSSAGLRIGKGNIINMKNEGTYAYEHKDNGNLNEI